MKLSSTDFGKIIHNALSWDMDETGKLYVHRFSEQQRQIYDLDSQDWGSKTRASASVTLDFVTDSEFIALKFTLSPGSSQRYFSIDLYVDGVFCANRNAEDLSVTIAGFALPEGEHRVTVYFPWTAQVVVSEVHLSDGASVIPVEKDLKMLCFGDSITQGYCSKFASLSYVNQVARELNAEVVNQGIGGYYFNDTTLDESILAYKPDIITVAYGTNDYSRLDTAEEYAERSGRYIRKLAKLFPDAKILGILPIYRNDLNHQSRKVYRTYTLDDARNILRSHYESCPNGYVLEETGIPHIPQVYAPDYLHPNELGFTVMAQGIAKKLKQIM